MRKPTKQEKADQLESMRDVFPKGSTVYGIVEHVAASGMSAVIRVVAFKDGQPLWPNWGAACITGMSFVEKNGFSGLRVNGCGFDRLQHVAGNIAYALYGDERALKYQRL